MYQEQLKATGSTQLTPYALLDWEYVEQSWICKTIVAMSAVHSGNRKMLFYNLSVVLIRRFFTYLPRIRSSVTLEDDEGHTTINFLSACPREARPLTTRVTSSPS
jgi:hypothetical protein